MDNLAALFVPSNVIYLKQENGRWVSISGFPERITKLLGTNKLPTRFSSHHTAELVYQSIQKENPDKFVMVME